MILRWFMFVPDKAAAARPPGTHTRITSAFPAGTGRHTTGHRAIAGTADCMWIRRHAGIPLISETAST